MSAFDGCGPGRPSTADDLPILTVCIAAETRVSRHFWPRSRGSTPHAGGRGKAVVSRASGRTPLGQGPRTDLLLRQVPVRFPVVPWWTPIAFQKPRLEYEIRPLGGAEAPRRTGAVSPYQVIFGFRPIPADLSFALWSGPGPFP